MLPIRKKPINDQDSELAGKMAECGISEYYWKGHSLPSLGKAGQDLREWLVMELKAPTAVGVFIYGKRRERQLALQVYAKEMVLGGLSVFVCSLMQYHSILQALANGNVEDEWITEVPNLCLVNFSSGGEKWLSPIATAKIEDNLINRTESRLVTHMSADVAFSQCDWWSQSFRTFMEPHLQSFNFGG